MPYATDNKISKAEIDGGITITDQQYKDAFKHMRSRNEHGHGGLIKVVMTSETEGELVLTYKPETQAGHKPPVWQDGDWLHEPLPEPVEVVESNSDQ